MWLAVPQLKQNFFLSIELVPPLSNFVLFLSHLPIPHMQVHESDYVIGVEGVEVLVSESIDLTNTTAHFS